MFDDILLFESFDFRSAHQPGWRFETRLKVVLLPVSFAGKPTVLQNSYASIAHFCSDCVGYLFSIAFAEYPNRVHGSASAMRTCLLYTSDAADEEDSVDLGGR